MKKFTVELTEKQVRELGDLMGHMMEIVSDLQQTQPGGILPTPDAFERYLAHLFKAMPFLHDKVMDDVLGSIDDGDA